MSGSDSAGSESEVDEDGDAFDMEELPIIRETRSLGAYGKSQSADFAPSVGRRASVVTVGGRRASVSVGFQLSKTKESQALPQLEIHRHLLRAAERSTILAPGPAAVQPIGECLLVSAEPRTPERWPSDSMSPAEYLASPTGSSPGTDSRGKERIQARARQHIQKMLSTIEKRTRERLSPASLRQILESELSPHGQRGRSGTWPLPMAKLGQGEEGSPLSRSMAVARVLGESFGTAGAEHDENFLERATADVASMLSKIVVQQKARSPGAG